MSAFNRMTERQVRGFFNDKTRPGTPITRSDASRIVKVILDPAYKSGALHAACSGGIRDPSSDLPTGLLPIRSLRQLHHDYPEVNWHAIAHSPEGYFPEALVYLAHVIDCAREYGRWEPRPGEDGVRVLHLDTYHRVPLYAHFAQLGPSAVSLPFHGVPAIYVSPLDFLDQTPTLSECSIDILEDRRSNSTHYNRGLVFDVQPRGMFYLDRMANVSYRESFINHMLSRDPSLAPADSDLRLHRNTLLAYLRDHHRLSDAVAQLTLTLETTHSLRYSALGYCLFETMHEFAMTAFDTLRDANRFLKALAPQQATLWSMASFSVPSLSHLKSVLLSFGVDYAVLAAYCAVHLPYKLRHFLGADSEYVDVCARLFMTYEVLWGIHVADPGGPLQSEALPLHGSPDTMRHIHMYYSEWLSIERGDLRVRFHTAEPPDSLRGRIAADAADPIIGTILRRHTIKTAFSRQSEAMCLNTLNLILDHRLGCLAIPFRPDSRGEMLLVPSIDNALVRRVQRVTISDSPSPNLFKQEDVHTSVTLQSYAGYDPSMPRTFPSLYSTEPATPREAYQQAFRNIAWESQVSALATSPTLRDKSLTAVIIPFFKEHQTFIDVAVTSARAILGSGDDAVVVLATNQESPSAIASSLRAESGLRSLGRDAARRISVLHVHSGSMNGVRQWMIRKFANVHAGVTAVCALADSGAPVQRLVVLEGDLHGVDSWWDQYFAEEARSAAPLTLFQFPVLIAPSEGSALPQSPTYDNSDSVLAELVAGPLTRVVMGTSLKQLFGGSYAMNVSVARAFRSLLDSSEHSESLVETWLPQLILGQRSVRVLTVGPKIHLPTSGVAETGLDGKVIKWVADLFFALDGYIALGGTADTVSIIRTGDLICNIVPSEASHIARRIDRLADWTALRPAVQAVLGAELTSAYDVAHDRLAATSDMAARDVLLITNGQWCETITRFFVAMRGKRAEEGDEMYALRHLIDFRILDFHQAFRRLIGADDIAPDVLARCRRLIADVGHVSNATVLPALSRPLEAKR